MGFLDHRKHWTFDTNATPTQCEAAFQRAFSGGRILGMRGKYTFDRMRDQDGDQLVAIYKGRRGLSSIGLMSGITRAHIEAAKGSRVAFLAQPAENGRTQCEMWLKRAQKMKIGMIADGGFLKRAMQAARREMKKLDPQVTMLKHKG